MKLFLLFLLATQSAVTMPPQVKRLQIPDKAVQPTIDARGVTCDWSANEMRFVPTETALFQEPRDIPYWSSSPLTWEVNGGTLHTLYRIYCVPRSVLMILHTPEGK